MFCLNNHITEENGNTNTNSNSNSFAWFSSSWEPPAAASSHTTVPETSASTRHRHQQQPLYGGSGSHVHPDPHLTCLYLGKRHYFQETNGKNNNNAIANANASSSTLPPPLAAGGGGKRACKSFYANASSGAAGGERAVAAAEGVQVLRCQVEGCHVALANAKEYHRRHRVCDMHSKAPKVVVLGLEQRFCQQCSRFHVVSEFDDSKRSCRRRLASHNERRRKSSNHSVTGINSTQGCALSLLSSGSDSCLSHADLSIRCSAALRELIAENRAALMTTRQLVFDRDWHLAHHAVQDFREMIPHESNYFPQQMFHHTQ